MPVINNHQTWNEVHTYGKLKFLPGYIQAEISLAARVLDVMKALEEHHITNDEAEAAIREIRGYKPKATSSILDPQT